MLDVNHPRASIIFKASSYTDKLKIYCGKYTIADFEKRQGIFLNMLLICDDFEQFYNLNYADHQWDVKVILELIKQEIKKLSVINIVTEPGSCKVCNGELFVYKSGIKEFGTLHNCRNCSSVIIEETNHLDSFTGAMFI